ncbi:3-dehydroquinate synthase [Streptococcus equi subsp. equi]|nr:3-dehydroquinate synthase [Streptococcus equi subsp. equi]
MTQTLQVKSRINDYPIIFTDDIFQPLNQFLAEKETSSYYLSLIKRYLIYTSLYLDVFNRITIVTFILLLQGAI